MFYGYSSYYSFSQYVKERYIVSSGSVACLYIFRSIGTEGRRSQLQSDCVEYKYF